MVLTGADVGTLLVTLELVSVNALKVALDIVELSTFEVPLEFIKVVRGIELLKLIADPFREPVELLIVALGLVIDVDDPDNKVLFASMLICDNKKVEFSGPVLKLLEATMPESEV